MIMPDKTEWKSKRDILRYTILEEKTRRNSSLGNRLSPKAPFFGQHSSGKVFLYAFFQKILRTLKKASLTVETALALPVFFFGLITLISFMDIYKLQTEHLSLLCDKTKEAGMYAYNPGGEGTEEITLPDIYEYKPVSGLIPLPAIWMHNTVKVHAWTGKEREIKSGDENEKTEAMVYVTVSGSVYHKNLSCSHLNLSVTQVTGSSVSSKRNEYGEKYHACESCSRNEEPGKIVYITNFGNRYHNDENCSGLKRTVRLIKESEAEKLRPCSRCG